MTTLRSFFKTIKTYAFAHKTVSGIIIIAVVLGGYAGYKKIFGKVAAPSYVTAAVEKGTIIASISGSGQVSASNQVDLKSKGSGDVTYVNVVNGQNVKAGTLIASLDASDASKALRDAQSNLESAKLSLQKLQKPADTLSLTQSQNALADAQDSKKRAEDDLVKAYDDAFTAVSNTFLDLPNIMTGMYDLLYRSSRPSPIINIEYYSALVPSFDAGGIDTYKKSADTSYKSARALYDKVSLAYKAVGRTSSKESIETLLGDTLTTVRAASESAKSTSNFFDYVNDRLKYYNHDIPPELTTDRATASSYTSKINTRLSDLVGSQTAIKNDKTTIENSLRTITERTESLAKLQAGSDDLDLRSAELSVEQRHNALLDAQLLFANYSIRAPFDGTIASMSIKRGDSVNSGTVAATLVTQQKIAEISLNEVDVAKIKLSNKVTLTFDAVPDLSISGEVAEIDTVGTVSQGVVSYNVKISFDTQDDRIKPGMSVSAAIITDSKQDVLIVPNSAIKTSNGESYVEILSSDGVPTPVSVTTGLSSDTSTEITSGLTEGELIITRTISASTKTTSTQAPSLFGGGTRTTSGATGGNQIRTFTR